MTSAQTPTPEQKTVAQMAAMVGSTLSMMRALCIDSNGLPKDTTLKDKNFRDMVVMEHDGAQLINRIKDEPDSLRIAVRIVEDNLASLSTSKDPNVINIVRPKYAGTYNEMGGRIQQAATDRNKLITEAKELKEQQTKTFRELGKNFKSKTQAEIAAELENLKSSQKKLQSRVNELIHVEQILTVQLGPLIVDTSQAVRGLGMVPTTAESIQPPRQT